MKLSVVIYTVCTIILGVCGTLGSSKLYEHVRDGYHLGTRAYFASFAIIFLGFTLPSLLVVVLGLANMAAGRLRRRVTRVQTWCLCATVVGIPVAAVGAYLYYRHYAYDDRHEAVDEDAYHRPTDRDDA